jgi:hypothetical protein
MLGVLKQHYICIFHAFMYIYNLHVSLNCIVAMQEKINTNKVHIWTKLDKNVLPNRNLNARMKNR